MTRALADTGHLLASAVRGVREPHLWRPASVALLPILFLHVTFGDLLRSRLSPSIWTVISGSLLILWMTQTAAAASWGWVDARRHRRRVQWGALGRRAADVGTKTTLGLLAGVLPGLWWQARLAFDPLQDGAARRRPDAAERWALLGLATATAVVSLLGQSLAAGLAEILGAITPAGIVDGRVQFTLNVAPPASQRGGVRLDGVRADPSGCRRQHRPRRRRSSGPAKRFRSPLAPPEREQHLVQRGPGELDLVTGSRHYET
jgi:hypothetical protein